MMNIEQYRWQVPEYDRPAHQKEYDTGRMLMDAYKTLAAERNVIFDPNAPTWEWPFSYADLPTNVRAAIDEATVANNATIKQFRSRPTEWELRGSRNGE